MPTEVTPRGTLTHIGGWKLGKTLGRGAYAHVRLATHPNGHKAACKILPALHHTPGQKVDWDATVDAMEAHKEVVLLKALCGAGVPGIVGLEGVMEADGWTYVFLTLYPHSASSLKPPWGMEAFTIFFRRLLFIVDNLHQLNVSHEDLKRSNVLVDAHGLPALVDFGFSHFKPDGGLVRSAGGTLDYSSPEKAADMPYDPKANDVWAMAILAFKLLGYPHPYAFNDPEEISSLVKKRIVEGGPVYQFSKRALRPGGIAELLMGMLERDPGRRWTISQALGHRSLKRKYGNPAPYELPSCNLSFMHKIDPSVVDDLCFLAFMSGEFFLCETPTKIVNRLHDKRPCWEKRWAGMLGAWSKRAEMDWEDIPSLITPLKTRSAPAERLHRADAIPGRALKKIQLVPHQNMKTSIRVQTPREIPIRKQNENTPPKPAPKSRIYGMKTRNQSTRNILGDISDSIAIEQSQNEDLKTGTLARKPKYALAKTKAKSPVHIDEVRPRPAKIKVKHKVTEMNVILSSDTEFSEQSSIAPPAEDTERSSSTFIHQTTSPTLAVLGATVETPIVIDGSPSRLTTRKGDDTRDKGTVASKGCRKKPLRPLHHNVKATTSLSADTGEQMRSLKLAPPIIKTPRRRSPRVESREGMTSRTGLR
ncbi:uncharacterized protein IL334_002546 [Kwoniella shivajii]|uniref:Protein kinase domain-containing protein n=1 Tax=Kwoniella shivajii TaxID=564305 RepID=A0ABZ1CY33_9TREE|nr:hypothetical protein IL334_002546 [Kwoniella shivajii]